MPRAPAGPAPAASVCGFRCNFEAPVGTGTHSTVYRCCKRSVHVPCVVKITPKKRTKPHVLQSQRREVAVLQRIPPHPAILPLLAATEDNHYCYAVSPYIGGGTLRDLVTWMPSVPRDFARDVLRNLLLGIAHMHAHGVMHRDIKLENVLLRCGADGLTTSTTAVLIDFGFATDEADSGYFCGTPYYVAPEVIATHGHSNDRDRRYSNTCDVWSLGVLAYVLVSGGVMPFTGGDFAACADAIVRNAPDWVPLDDAPAAKAFVRHLLVSDPDKRPTAAAALSHAWLQRDASTDLEASSPTEGGASTTTQPHYCLPESPRTVAGDVVSYTPSMELAKKIVPE